MKAHSRSRRLRKKLHVGEFQQMGFSVDFTLDTRLNAAQSDQFWDAFIEEAIEANQLIYGGGESGYVLPEGRISATEAHRELIKSWLQSRPEVIAVNIGSLSDAWYPDLNDGDT